MAGYYVRALKQVLNHKLKINVYTSMIYLHIYLASVDIKIIQ